MSSSESEQQNSNKSKSLISGKQKKSIKVILTSIIWPVVFFILAQLIAWILVASFNPEIFEEDYQMDITQVFAVTMLYEVLILVLLAIYLKVNKLDWKWLGLGKFDIKQFKYLFPAIGAYIVMAITAFFFVSLLVSSVDLEQEQEIGFETASTNSELLLAFVALVILTPIVEELLIRGFMFRNLNRVIGFRWAALISAAIFAILHGQINVGIDTFVLGLVLAWLVYKTDSLYPAIAMHMLKNSIAFYGLFIS